MVDYAPASQEADEDLREDTLYRLSALARDPAKVAAFANGLIQDGMADRLKMVSGLQQFMTLRQAEAKNRVRVRMARPISQTHAGNGCGNRKDLKAGSFSAAEIAEHSDEAKRGARVAGMVI